MKKLTQVALLTVGLISSMPVLAASSPTNAFSTCMVDSLTGKERKDLAKWIFLSMTAHPDIKPFSSATPAEIKSSDQSIGKLITRLLTVDCPTQLIAANKANPRAVQNAFKLVGQVAMQELMTNEATMKALTNYAKYTDQAKINKLLSQH